jgi:4,5-DOPA dioxygenase extradiol
MKRIEFLSKMGLLPLALSTNQMTAIENLADGLPPSEKMPVLFLGHGSPMNAIEDNAFVQEFKALGRKLPAPKAILCISAHWFTKGTKVTAMEKPKTIHDFGGFPKALFDIQYPAPGNPSLAIETKELLLPAAVEANQSWGLDHGAWTVLMHLYPKADVPVIQLSLDYTQGPEYHYQLAGRLKKLRHKGILIVGSGNIVHNLGLADFPNIGKDNYGYDWAIEARALVNQYLLSGNHQPLVRYQQMPRAIQLAVPTPDHYLPLLYTLGLQDPGEPIQLFNDKLLAGSLSMTSVRIGG